VKQGQLEMLPQTNANNVPPNPYQSRTPALKAMMPVNLAPLSLRTKTNVCSSAQAVLLQATAIVNLVIKGLIVSRVNPIPHAQHVQQDGTTMILGKHHACPVKPGRPTTLPTQAARTVHLAKNPALVACAKPRVRETV